jgi:hypothetical protein
LGSASPAFARSSIQQSCCWLQTTAAHDALLQSDARSPSSLIRPGRAHSFTQGLPHPARRLKQEQAMSLGTVPVLPFCLHFHIQRVHADPTPRLIEIIWPPGQSFSPPGIESARHAQPHQRSPSAALPYGRDASTRSAFASSQRNGHDGALWRWRLAMAG